MSSSSNNVFIPILPINAGGGNADAPIGAAPEVSFTEADLRSADFSLDAADGTRLTSSISSHLEPVAYPPNYVEGFVRP